MVSEFGVACLFGLRLSRNRHAHMSTNKHRETLLKTAEGGKKLGFRCAFGCRGLIINLAAYTSQSRFPRDGLRDSTMFLRRSAAPFVSAIHSCFVSARAILVLPGRCRLHYIAIRGIAYVPQPESLPYRSQLTKGFESRISSTLNRYDHLQEELQALVC